jgi:predicted HicB family RNase H-like nuclease
MENEKKITIRISDDLHQKLIEAARRDTRSINGEIITLLEKALIDCKKEQSLILV